MECLFWFLLYPADEDKLIGQARSHAVAQRNSIQVVIDQISSLNRNVVPWVFLP